MDPLTTAPTVPELIAIWELALLDIVDIASPLTDEQWNAPTPCPGWTVADVVAHTSDMEWVFSGDARPDHTPDWDALPHVTGAFGQFTEAGVDYRRGMPQDDVIGELRARIRSRRAQLDALPPDSEAMGFSGGTVPLTRFLRTRTFDAWVHEQDIREATGQAGHWASLPAVIAFQQMAAALAYVWGKNVGAPPGATVRVSVTGPEFEADLYATIDDAGKGLASPCVDDVDVHLTLSWPDYMRLSCGRIDVADPGLLGRIALDGDAALGAALLGGMAVTP